MCGIAGVLTFDGRPVAEAELTALTGALAHRGRDSAGVGLGGSHTGSVSSYPGVGLGHRRLSIIDLSSESAQPMVYGGGAFWITYNGELYNFEELRRELAARGCEFRTHCDTEVVLAAYSIWGDQCLAHFNGMFAFAIWDEQAQSLFCARDAIGVKPFYYVLERNTFRFASEAQALARMCRTPLAREALTGYLLSMYVPGRASIFEGIQKLLPGRFMRVHRDGTVVEKTYWAAPRCDYAGGTIEDAAVRMQAELDRAVRAQLRSDVPVGALLSGGFDSGMVVASAAGLTTDFHTYSVGFDDCRQTNELPIARSLAERYGTRHHERTIESGEVIGILDRAITCMSEPVADSAIVPTYALSQMAAADGVKVLLSGTGGDEVFAGYPRYVGTALRRRMLLALPAGIRRTLASLVTGRAENSARLRHRGLDMLITTGGSPRLARYMFADEGAFGEYLERLAVENLPAAAPDASEVYQHMQFDLMMYLPDLLLLLLDQLTMAHTLEGRVPLLDVELIAASYSLPAGMHVTGSETKRLMRRMASGRLDPRTLTAPKQGFSGPVAHWIADNAVVFRERTMAVREIPALADLPVERFWRDDERRSRPRWAAEIFSLYCLSVWHHAHVRA